MLELIAVSFATVLASVGIHYEFLQLASTLVRRRPGQHRMRVSLMIVLAVAAHLVEVGVFAVGWAWCLERGIASLDAASSGSYELFYFSGSLYTSLGFGDIVPLAGGRVLAVVEGVTGLVLIAWTASFTYVAMQANWGDSLGD